MKPLKIFKTIVLISTIFLPTHAMSSEVGPKISLYNIGTGYLPYTYHNGANTYLGFNYAYELTDDDYPQRASWNIIYNTNGTVSFKNDYKNLCIEWYYGSGYRTIQNTCNVTNEKQQFDLQLTETGALLIKSRKNGQCLYRNSGDLYNGTCDTENRDYFWAIIPPLEGNST